jgi:Fe-S oxidoreductase/nitrate reductase gamma subunit
VFNALEILVLVVACIVVAAGLGRRWYWPRRKRLSPPPADWSGLLAAVLFQRKIMARPLVGAAHLGLVWGFLVFILVVIVGQMPLALPVSAARAISLLLDVTGAVMLAATLFFIIRRLTLKSAGDDAGGPRRTLPPLLVLLVILISGFFAEGARLNLVFSQSALTAPVGWLCATFLPESPRFMQAMIRVHMVFVALFVLLVPFTFMRHLGSTSAHLLLKSRWPAQLPAPVDLEEGPLGARSLADFSAQQLREAEACVRCGRCDEQCPALMSGKPLSPRAIMRKICDQMEATGLAQSPPPLSDAIHADEIWACTTCMACVAHCPADIRPMDKVLEMRRGRVLGQGELPAEAVPMIRNLELFGDVNGKGAAHKADWAMNRDVPKVSVAGAPDVLLWVGCSGAFHPAGQETTRALVKLLRAGGVHFGILAHEELCCGDPARKLGDEALFLSLAHRNIDIFNKYGVRRIVTLCPHCFNTLGREYAELGCALEVEHAAQLVSRLIAEKKITLQYPLDKSLAIHDPCYLGRYNGVYEPLRLVGRAVPGLRLSELPRHREHGFCCGGGGGRMWLHENLGRNINVLRAEEVARAGVDAVATACPYCLTMLEDGLKAVAPPRPVQVIDVIQLAADALGETTP